jgi:hypothetical protein
MGLVFYVGGNANQLPRAIFRGSITSTTLTVPSGTPTVINNWVVTTDNYNAFTSGTTYTIPVTGMYVLSAGVRLGTATTISSGTIGAVAFVINGSSTFETVTLYSSAQAGVNVNLPSITTTAQLAKGTTVTVQVLQSSSSSVTTINGATDNFFTIAQIN